MQKKLIALAIAGLSGAAFAQSNVTIYGAMDATYDNVSASGASAGAGSNRPSRGRTTMNSSFIGFKGAEDLGGGLKAVFQIETGLGENGSAVGAPAAAATAYGWAGRDTYVGLAGGFGTLVAGTLSGPTRVVGAAMDINAGSTGIGANAALIGKLGGGSGAGYFDTRISNAIAYISPTISGFHGVIGYLPNESRTTDAAATQNLGGWTLGGVYGAGPIFAAMTYTVLKDSNANTTSGAATALPTHLGTALLGVAVATPIEKADNTRLAFKYDFGQGTVGVMWDSTKATVITAAGGVSVDAKQTVWYIPVTFKLGNGKLIGQYGKANNVSGSLINAYNTAGVCANAGSCDYSASHFALGYEYTMSKRTIAKVMWSQINNAADAGNDFLYGVSAPNTAGYGRALAGGADPRGLSVGIRHSF